MCDVFECQKETDLAEGSLEILHAGCRIGIICKDCLDQASGIRLFLKPQDFGLELEQVDLLEKVI